jgi:glycosyltransferase involved in cell wall biosynthesis
MTRLVLIDADVLGRRRTGEETYVTNLLRSLPSPALEAGLRVAAVTRRPDLVPDEIEPIALAAGSQELRMSWRLPRLLRKLRPSLAHFQHGLPLLTALPTVVTVHDLSFERSWTAMPLMDTIVFRARVPRSVRSTSRVIAVSERTKRDIVGLYGLPSDRVTVIPHGVDPAFEPGGGGGGGRYLLFVGAIQERKDPLAAADAAQELGMPLVVVGPERDAGLARKLRRRGVDLRGYVDKGELADLYRGAACLLLPSRYEGFGLPILEAMASGTPVVASADPALQEVADGAAVFAPRDGLAAAVRRALAERERLSEAGLERARLFDWAEAAKRHVDVYLEAIG